jgi:hypothetical protein
MTVDLRGTRCRVVLENANELVVIEASAARLNAWARVLAARTAAAVDDGNADQATRRSKTP